MDTLAWGMQNLQLAEIVSDPARAIDTDDRDFLAEGVAFLERIRSAVGYRLNDGPPECLDESASFSEARYACATLRALNYAKTLPSVQKRLEGFADTLRNVLEGKPVSPARRRDAENFFAAVGSAVVSESSSDEVVVGESDDDDLSEPGEDSEQLAHHR